MMPKILLALTSAALLGLTACAGTQESADKPAATAATPALSAEAQAALSAAQADVKSAKAQNALWTTAENALKAAEAAGLDLQKALADAQKPQAEAMLKQEVDDLTSLEVKRTPTFFVNGRTLGSLGPEQLAALVAEEVSKTKK